MRLLMEKTYDSRRAPLGNPGQSTAPFLQHCESFVQPPRGCIWDLCKKFRFFFLFDETPIRTSSEQSKCREGSIRPERNNACLSKIRIRSSYVKINRFDLQSKQWVTYISIYISENKPNHWLAFFGVTDCMLTLSAMRN